jgi:hypothetical protein
MRADKSEWNGCMTVPQMNLKSVATGERPAADRTLILISWLVVVLKLVLLKLV